MTDGGVRVRWGNELDVAIVTDEDLGRRRVRAYLAKYSTKSTEDQGVLDHRLRAGVPDALELPLTFGAWSKQRGTSVVSPVERTEAAGMGTYCRISGALPHEVERFSTTFAELRGIRKQWQLEKKRWRNAVSRAGLNETPTAL